MTKTAATFDLKAIRQWPVVSVELGTLNPAPYNPRIPDRPSQLDSSMTQFGVLQPIVYNKRTGNIIGGHKRYDVFVEAAKEQYGDEWKRVPVQVVEADLDEDMEKVANISLNRIGADTSMWDYEQLGNIYRDLNMSIPEFDLNITGWNEDDRESFLAADWTPPPPSDDGTHSPSPKKDDIHEMELSETPQEESGRCKTGDVWKLGEHRLMCGSANVHAHVTKLLNGESVGVAIFDPVSTGEFAQWVNVEAESSFFLNAEQYASKLNGQTEKGGSWLVWDKHIDSVNNRPFMLIWSTVEAATSILRIQAKSVFNDETKDAIVPSARVVGKLVSLGQGLVYDVHGTHGQTLIACEQMKRTCYVMCDDPLQCEIILSRWEQITGRVAKKLTRKSSKKKKTTAKKTRRKK